VEKRLLDVNVQRKQGTKRYNYAGKVAFHCVFSALRAVCTLTSIASESPRVGRTALVASCIVQDLDGRCVVSKRAALSTLGKAVVRYLTCFQPILSCFVVLGRGCLLRKQRRRRILVSVTVFFVFEGLSIYSTWYCCTVVLINTAHSCILTLYNFPISPCHWCVQHVRVATSTLDIVLWVRNLLDRPLTRHGVYQCRIPPPRSFRWDEVIFALQS
jgi:hypothetical protein